MHNTKQKTLPNKAAFSNPTSHGVISNGEQVSPEQLLKQGRRINSQRKRDARAARAQQKAADKKRGGVRGGKQQQQQQMLSSSVQMLSPQEVKANLAQLDRKLEQEQARRLELEGVLRRSPEKASDPNTLGHTLSAREQKQTTSSSKTSRISSPGSVLRRGSQVAMAPRSSPPVTSLYGRQYRHARELEDDMIRTEEELAVTKAELSRVTTTLITVQNELDVRTKDLEQSRGKVDSLLRMVKHVLQHLVEKREARRFSMQASTELQRQIAEPLSASFGETDTKMSDYVDERIKAIDSILPQWSAVYGSGYNDSAPELYAAANDMGNDDDSVMSSNVDMSEAPPPLPPAMAVSRRNVKSAADIPLPSPPPGFPPRTNQMPEPPSENVVNALLEIWDRIDEEEDGVLSAREINTKLMSVVPGVSLDLRDAVMENLNGGALVVHNNGNAAFEEDQFVKALQNTPCGLQLVRLVERDLEEEYSANNAPTSAERQKLNEWSRKMSTPLYPRGIHDHKKQGL